MLQRPWTLPISPQLFGADSLFWGGESTEEKVDWRIMFHDGLWPMTKITVWDKGGNLSSNNLFSFFTNWPTNVSEKCEQLKSQCQDLSSFEGLTRKPWRVKSWSWGFEARCWFDSLFGKIPSFRKFGGSCLQPVAKHQQDHKQIACTPADTWGRRNRRLDSKSLPIWASKVKIRGLKLTSRAGTNLLTTTLPMEGPPHRTDSGQKTYVRSLPDWQTRWNQEDVLCFSQSWAWIWRPLSNNAQSRGIGKASGFARNVCKSLWFLHIRYWHIPQKVAREVSLAFYNVYALFLVVRFGTEPGLRFGVWS